MTLNHIPLILAFKMTFRMTPRMTFTTSEFRVFSNEEFEGDFEGYSKGSSRRSSLQLKFNSVELDSKIGRVYSKCFK